MRLTDPRSELYSKLGYWGHVSIDALVRQAARLEGESIALKSHPELSHTSTFLPSSLSWSDLDKAVSRFALILFETGLRPGQTAGIYLRSGSEALVSFLACLRLGVMPAILPTTWNEKELKRALDPLCPRVIITGQTSEDNILTRRACRAAVHLFSIRAILGFGENLPDGVTPVQHVLLNIKEDLRLLPHVTHDADRIAHISFSARTTGGFQPFYRAHAQLIAGGLQHLMHKKETLQDCGSYLSFMHPLNVSTLEAIVMPWLLQRGTLSIGSSEKFEYILDTLNTLQPETTLLLPQCFLEPLSPLFPAHHKGTIYWNWSQPEAYTKAVIWRPKGTHLLNFDNLAVIQSHQCNDLFALPQPSEGESIPLMPEVIISPQTQPVGRSALWFSGPTVAARTPNEIEGARKSSYEVSVKSEGLAQRITGIHQQEKTLSIGNYRLNLEDIIAVLKCSPHIETVTLKSGQKQALSVHLTTRSLSLEDAKTLVQKQLREAGFSPLVQALPIEILPQQETLQKAI